MSSSTEFTGPRNRLRRRGRRAAVLAVVGLGASSALAGCGDDSSGSDETMTLRTLDSYTEELDGAVTEEILTACGDEAGVEIERQAIPLDQLLAQVLRQASEESLPDLVLLDNLYVQRVAEAGALSSMDTYGFDDADSYYASVIDAATYDGKLYGVATAVDTLGLYYNETLLNEAGIEPPRSWEQLVDAAEQLTDGQQYGINFAAIANEEGTFQFLPFFWSAGATLTDIDSPEAAEALQLWVDLVGNGYASRDVVNWDQGDITDQFLAGNAAMMVNGPWALAELQEAEGLEFGMVPLPSPTEGENATVPLGGEIWTLPVTDDERQAKAWEVLDCMLQSEEMLKWGEETAHIPAKPDVAGQMDDPTMRAFQEILETARPRTAELGPDYPATSQPLWNALQSAIIGEATPEEALATAAEEVSN